MAALSPDLLAQLAPEGRLRVAINLGNVVLVQADPATGEPRGVTVDLAHELARRAGLPVSFKAVDTAGKSFAALAAGECDVGFLAIDPKRAAELDFTPPYVIIEGSYLVRKESPLRTVEDVDAPGVRIAAGRNTAYDLFLSRSLRHAALEYAPTSADALDLFARERLEAAAGVRQPLVAYAARNPGYRVMDGRFMVIEQAMTLPKGRPDAAGLLRGFIEEMKAGGFVADALRRSGQGDATVAPPASQATQKRE